MSIKYKPINVNIRGFFIKKSTLNFNVVIIVSVCIKNNNEPRKVVRIIIKANVLRVKNKPSVVK